MFGPCVYDEHPAVGCCAARRAQPTALRKLHRTQQKERLTEGEAHQLGSHGGYVAADELGGGYTTQRLRKTFYCYRSRS